MEIIQYVQHRAPNSSPALVTLVCKKVYQWIEKEKIKNTNLTLLMAYGCSASNVQVANLYLPKL